MSDLEEEVARPPPRSEPGQGKVDPVLAEECQVDDGVVLGSLLRTKESTKTCLAQVPVGVGARGVRAGSSAWNWSRAPEGLSRIQPPLRLPQANPGVPALLAQKATRKKPRAPDPPHDVGKRADVPILRPGTAQDLRVPAPRPAPQPAREQPTQPTPSAAELEALINQTLREIQDLETKAGELGRLLFGLDFLRFRHALLLLLLLLLIAPSNAGAGRPGAVVLEG